MIEIIIKGEDSIEVHLATSLEKHEKTGEKIREYVDTITVKEFLEIYNEMKMVKDIIAPSEALREPILVKESEKKQPTKKNRRGKWAI